MERCADEPGSGQVGPDYTAPAVRVVWLARFHLFAEPLRLAELLQCEVLFGHGGVGRHVQVGLGQGGVQQLQQAPEGEENSIW